MLSHYVSYFLSYILPARTCVIFCAAFYFNSLPFYVVFWEGILSMFESQKLKGSRCSMAEQQSCKEFSKSSALFLLGLPLHSENVLLYFYHRQQLSYIQETGKHVLQSVQYIGLIENCMNEVFIWTKEVTFHRIPFQHSL